MSDGVIWSTALYSVVLFHCELKWNSVKPESATPYDWKRCGVKIPNLLVMGACLQKQYLYLKYKLNRHQVTNLLLLRIWLLVKFSNIGVAFIKKYINVKICIKMYLNIYFFKIRKSWQAQSNIHALPKELWERY